jgi:hypothetical protein
MSAAQLPCLGVVCVQRDDQQLTLLVLCQALCAPWRTYWCMLRVSSACALCSLLLQLLAAAVSSQLTVLSLSALPAASTLPTYKVNLPQNAQTATLFPAGCICIFAVWWLSPSLVRD